MSNFERAITPSIFELERRTKSQNVGYGITYLDVGLNVGYEKAPEPQNGVHFENFKIFEIGSF